MISFVLEGRRDRVLAIMQQLHTFHSYEDRLAFVYELIRHQQISLKDYLAVMEHLYTSRTYLGGR